MNPVHLLTSGHNAKCGAAWSAGAVALENVTCARCRKLASPSQVDAARERLERGIDRLRQKLAALREVSR